MRKTESKGKSTKYVINIGTIFKQYKGDTNFDAVSVRVKGLADSPKEDKSNPKKISSKATPFNDPINAPRSTSMLNLSRVCCRL